MLLGTRSLLFSLRATLAIAGLAAPAFFAGSQNAMALSQEQALATCRETTGRPIVQACMQSMGGGGGGNREANLAKCRGTATPKVRACVMAAMNKANGRANVAIEVGKAKEEVIAPGSSLPAGFVAPPRTIADITAILDNEKPDAATLAKLRKTPRKSRRPRYRRPIWPTFTTTVPMRAPCWAAPRMPWPMPKRRCR